MFEYMTFEYILKETLKNVPSNVDKRQGSVIYDAVAPLCAVIAQMYISLENVLNQTFADTASREYLIRRAEERGLFPKASTKAVVKAEFNIPVPIGSKFYGNGVLYIVTENIGDFNYKLECQSEGVVGNLYFGDIIPVQNIEGLENAKIVDVVIYGEDEEDTEVFRQRYLDSFNALAFGGNKRDYIEKTNLISGVGGCKVIPAFDGGGTVKLIIITSAYSVPSDYFISNVKSQVDPEGFDGEGEGFAPIGHSVTVCGVKEKVINIDVWGDLNEGFEKDDVLSDAKTLVADYFYSLAKSWADSERIEVIAMKIGTDIFSCQAVKSVSDIRLNGGRSFDGMVLDFDEIPALGDIVINCI